MTRGAGRSAGIGVAVLLVTGCGGIWPDRRAVTVTEEARLTSPDTVELVVRSCNGDPEVSRLVEGDRQVQVEITSTVTDPGDACADVVEVRLGAPLDRRDLIDLTSGGVVRVAGRTGG